MCLCVAGEAAERADGVQQRGGRGLRTGTPPRPPAAPAPAQPRFLKSFPSPQGHLTRFLSFGLGLSVTAVEADRALVAMATKFDAQLVSALEKEQRREVRALAAPHSQTEGRSPPGFLS